MSDYKRRQIKYCRRCKYHGILSVVRGHKGSCNFNTCDCSSCSQLPPPVLGKRKPTRHVKIGGIVESKEDQIMVDAWINGEDVEDDGSLEKADKNDVDFLPNAEPQKTATVASTVASSGKTVKLPVALMRALATQQTSPAASTEERSKILKQIKELHELKECGALSSKEFEETKAVLLRAFR